MSRWEIRPLSFDEMAVPLAWAEREGWNPGLHDRVPFWHADKVGFIGGFLDGALIASVAAVRYEPGFGFVGFYIVAPAYRGQGFGLQVWEAGLAHLEGLACLGLDGVIAQQHNYQKAGFVLAHRNARFEGYPQRDGHSIRLGPSERLRSTADVSFYALAEFDAQHFPAPRSEFLKHWIKQPGHRGRVILRGNAACAYGVIRPCVTGYKIGPLFAQTPEQARHLVLALCHNLPADAPVYLDPPTENADAMSLVSAFGMRQVFETARMYKGSAPALPIAQVFGVTSFELG